MASPGRSSPRLDANQVWAVVSRANYLSPPADRSVDDQQAEVGRGSVATEQPVETLERWRRRGEGEGLWIGMGSVGRRLGRRQGISSAGSSAYERRGGTVPATENPRVGGSIPPLATKPISMNRMGFSALPAYHGRRGRKTTDHRTFGNRTRRFLRSALRGPGNCGALINCFCRLHRFCFDSFLSVR